MTNGLSVDLEEWYDGLISLKARKEVKSRNLESRIHQETETLLELLEKYDQRATFFVLGPLAEDHPSLIEEIEEAGHEIGSHGYSHRPVYELSPDQFKEDISRSIDALQSVVHQEIKGYRAPMFSVSSDQDWVFDKLLSEGINYDASLSPFQNPLYGDSDAPRFPYRISKIDGDIWEVPISTIKVFNQNMPFAGGFYLRFMPVRFAKWGLRQVNNEGYPGVIYLHPWELDPGQPKPNEINLRERFTHYWKLGSTQKKFEKLLQEFQFNTLSEMLSELQ